jgi:hypothetical protein
VPVHLALFISFSIPINIAINRLTVLSAIVIAGGLYFFFVGFHLLARKHLLLTTPTSPIRNAPFGPVEVNGFAAGPNTVTAPVSGKPCFLYRTTAWLHLEKNGWEKVAEETLHVPFFLVDASTKESKQDDLDPNAVKEDTLKQDPPIRREDDQLLIEPLGADLDLQPDLREEYSSLFVASGSDELPPRVIAFLSRHRIVPSRRLRIEERSIKPDESLFIAGTRMVNPGVAVRSPKSHGKAGKPQEKSPSTLGGTSRMSVTPQIIRLAAGAAPTSTREMSQQAKIAAALNRAGITRPEAWSAAGVSLQSVAVKENAPPAVEAVRTKTAAKHTSNSSSSDQTPPVVMMKGSDDAAFVISFRSQKGVVVSLAWKSTAMIGVGASIVVLGIYVLLDQMKS